MAIDQAVYLAFAPSGDGNTHLQSLTFEGEVSFALDDVPDKIDGDWGNFPARRSARIAAKRAINSRTGLQGLQRAG